MAELLIIFRETLEAVLIVGILLTYLSKTQRKELIPRIWQGVGAALFLSLIASILVQNIAGGLSSSAEKIFEGVAMLTAAIVLGTMIVWMAKNSNIAVELEGKAEKTLEQSSGVGWGIFTLAFIAVFREGIETVLFLYGVMINQGSVSLLSSLAGAAGALGIGYLIFIQGQRVPLKTFFNVSSVLLIFVAAGMVAYGFHELESAGIIPDTGRIWDVNPPKFSDGSYPAFHDKGSIGAIAKGLFGWNGDQSYAEVGAWFTAVLVLAFAWRRANSSAK